MKKPMTIFTKLGFIAIFAFSSCDTVSTWLREEFNSERPAHQNPELAKQLANIPNAKTVAYSPSSSNNDEEENPNIYIQPGNSPSQTMQQDNYFQDGSSSGTFYIVRGNNVSVVPIKGYSNQYVITLSGIANNILFFNANQGLSTGSMTANGFTDLFSENSSPNAALLVLRNDPKKTQKDMMTSLIIKDPKYNPENQTMSFTIFPKEDIKNTFVQNNLGSCALIVQF